MSQNSDYSELVPAACYARRSTGLQYYSIEHQLAQIEAFAVAKGFELVRTFTDDRSGLTLSGRPGLRALLGEALSGVAVFKTILVYDVSRWGRFQDLDQAAHYEFICRKSGISVEYCNEPFSNNGSPEANLIKQIKRSIAAEYSRDLSQRLSRAKLALASKGFHQCGAAPYGLRQMVLDQRGRPKAVLQNGDQKLLAGYRTVLIHGPEGELETIRTIFDWFVEKDLSRTEIARRLNLAGRRRTASAGWTCNTVSTVLRNRIYAGDLVFGKTTAPLRSTKVTRPENDWVHCRGVLPPIVDPGLFDRAQGHRPDRCRLSNQEMLAALVALRTPSGRLSRRSLAGRPDLPSERTYARRFGSLQAAFKASGANLHPHARLTKQDDS